jgi:hypothetical protein
MKKFLIIIKFFFFFIIKFLINRKFERKNEKIICLFDTFVYFYEDIFMLEQRGFKCRVII